MTIRVTVVYSPAPREVIELALLLPQGATVRLAVQSSGLLARFPELDPAAAGVGIWGRAVRADQLLRDLDRVELYRALTVDPKVARRERFQRQGARTTGLFARRRPGAGAGY